jgi:hypothetical protein
MIRRRGSGSPSRRLGAWPTERRVRVACGLAGVGRAGGRAAAAVQQIQLDSLDSPSRGGLGVGRPGPAGPYSELSSRTVALMMTEYKLYSYHHIKSILSVDSLLELEFV